MVSQVFIAKEKADALKSYEIWRKKLSHRLVILNEDHSIMAGLYYKIVVKYKLR